MAIGREFLSWTGPPLQRVAEWLVERYRRGPLADLGATVVVVPGSRVGRLLRQAILQEAARRNLGCFPPLITTVGQLPELLYQARRPLASSLVQQLAWTAAMQQLPTGNLDAFIRRRPAGNEPLQWLDLGQLLVRQHAELAAEGIDFGDVLRQAAQLSEFQEHARWELLADLQRRYWRVLDELQLWDPQTARLVALERGECRWDRDLVLVGTVDLSHAVRRMIDTVGHRATALVLAPEGSADRFDTHGCLIPAAWQEAPIAVGERQWRVVEGPAEQAAAVAHWLAELNGAYRADQVSIGVPDPRLVPWIQAALRASQVPNRYGPGRAIRETRVGRLLQAVADLLQQDDFHAQAALARHVDITRWLIRKGTPPNWESELDCYHATYLPAYRLMPDSVRLENKPQLQQAIGRLEQLMRPLRGESRKLHRWATPLADWLAEVYGGESAERQEPVARALQCVGQSLAELGEVPDALAPSVTAAQALRIVLRQLFGDSIPAPSDVTAVELLGWLELPLDPAPAMLVTSMNEGIVPQAVNGDLFLPDRLRRKLGIEDNRRRYARDAYALQMILHRRADVQLISARRDSQGNPLWMSRLLGACQPVEMAQRCLRFWSEEEAAPRPISRRASTNTSEGFRVPRPNRLDLLPEPLPITDLSAYLRCPYRFYLQRLLKLSAVCDDRLELDRSGFGTLAHDVLCAFGKSDVKDCSSVDHLRTSLREILDQVVRERFDERPLAATCVQIEQLWERLKAFAVQQAQWRDQGWRIEQVEVLGQDVCAPWEVDGHPVRLTGRIDRIDVHEDTGQRILWDYKTSDDGDSPDKTHRKKNEWVDLQLPLYRHLCQPANVDLPVGLGYITLPKKVDDVEFQRANWSADDLAAADQQAMEVVRNIRRQLFWPPHEDSLKLKDALAAIYQAGVLDRKSFSSGPIG